MDIEWTDGAVCFAGGAQVRIKANSFSAMERLTGGGTWRPELRNIDMLVKTYDLQLNIIKQGDYIEASELDTEKKYNDAVEVFGLFGFALLSNGNDFEWLNRSDTYKIGVIVATESKLMGVRAEFSYYDRKRKLTYPQLMAIGKLKRAMIERDEALIDAVENTSILSDALNGNHSESPNSCEDEWTDKHYNNFYQLTDEDIKTGKIKVDAYFVNRMWKINQWDDTGAAFHVLKTLPRIANNKNTLKRELVALKKQVDILCKLHGVDDEELK